MLAFKSLKDRIPEVTGIALVLLLLSTVWLGVRYVNQAEWVRHTLEVQFKINQIWSLLQDVDIGQRTYVLTGNERFLAPYRTATAQMAGSLDELQGLVSDNPTQIESVAEIRGLVSERLAFAEKTILTRRQAGFEATRDLVGAGQGFALSEQLRDRFAQMNALEAQLLDDRLSEARSAIFGLSIAILLGLAGVLAALGAWIISTRRASRELAGANAALRESIADREAAELQVRQMQKMEAIGQLTGGIAHDFNNMLTVIINGIILAQKRIASGTAGANELLASALEGANRASTLVRRLMAFSRQQPLAPEPLDANKFVAGMSELIARALGEAIRMETILGGGLWQAEADPAQLESSILNLCVNARDAMPEGGRLTVETANCHLDDRYSRNHPGVPAGQYVLIAVTDTGFGMTPEVLAKAFDPFFTTKETGKGTGLGLSQVFGFVKQSGGHVKIYSEPGQGTSVKVYLPRYYGEARDKPRVVAAAAELKGTESILLVEDDANVLSVASSALRELGYTVIEARHAREALAHLQNGARFDLLLTDIVMPDMNGRKLADEALRQRQGLKVLFMTGFTKNAVVHNGVLDPGVNFLAKPFTVEELSRKVREALETPGES